jgi:GTP-binding protein
VELPDFRTLVIADIPGIIEGAHEGKGLGHQFLRHVERTRALAILVPVDAPDPQAEYELLREELARYSPALSERPHCLVLSKADLLAPGDAAPSVKAPEAWGTYLVSAVSRKGMPALLEALWERARRVEAGERAAEQEDEDAWWTP